MCHNFNKGDQNLSNNPGISLLHPFSNKVFKISLFVSDDDIFRNVLRLTFGGTSDIDSIAFQNRKDHHKLEEQSMTVGINPLHLDLRNDALPLRKLKRPNN